MSPFGLLRACAVVLSLMPIGIAQGAALALADADSATRLLERYSALKEELRDNAFRRPLHMESSERPDSITGEVFALVDTSFAVAGTELAKPSQWCAILTLHLNTKYCKAAPESGTTVLHVRIGKKYDQPVADAYPVDFAYRVAAATPGYLRVMLEAKKGPLGTHDYRIVLEAAPVANGRTFIHLSYSYSYGMAAQVAMGFYLDTVGRDKVGFTVVGRDADGGPRYIDGMRGVVERNAIRYYLAIEAFLGSLSTPAPGRVEQSLRGWFAAVERYPRQLHEMKEAEYLAMKRKEFARQP